MTRSPTQPNTDDSDLPSRRDLFAKAGKAGIALAGVAAFPGLWASPAGAAPKRRISGIQLPPYPFYPNLARTMTPAQDLLDDLAADYGRSESNPTMDDFLLGWAPSRLVERSLGNQGRNLDPAETLWILHLTGYFGGIWLRLKFVEFSGPRFGRPPTESSFAALATRLDGAVAALNGNNAEALAYAESSLRGAALAGLADSYGYNAGYLDQILGGSKPAAVTAPSNYFTFTDGGLFDATYSAGELYGLNSWRQRSEPRGHHGRRIEEIITGSGGADDLRAIQTAAVARGRATWSPANSFLSIANWDQPSYDSLISTSDSFLQAIQMTGMAALAAAARGQGNWAHQVAWASALLAPFGGSYSVGLFDNAFDGQTAEAALPQFLY